MVLLIFIGFVAGKAKLVRGDSVRDLSNLVFLVLTQALLFRTMSSVHLEQLDFKPVAQYFLAAGILFVAMLWAYGGSSRASVLALAGIFSNTLMIGVPLIGLAYGQEGQVLLFTLISLHALVLLSAATLVLELQVAREQAVLSGAQRPIWRTVASAVRNAIIHPVPLPILLGLAYAQTGWGLHPVVGPSLGLAGQRLWPHRLGAGGHHPVANARGAAVHIGPQTFVGENRFAPGADAGGGLVAGPAGLAFVGHGRGGGLAHWGPMCSCFHSATARKKTP